MKEEWLNKIFEFADKADEKLSSPNYLRVLLGFWIAITICGLFLLGATIIDFDWMVFVIGMVDCILGAAFGVYYYSQFKEAKGRHQKPEKK